MKHLDEFGDQDDTDMTIHEDLILGRGYFIPKDTIDFVNANFKGNIAQEWIMGYKDGVLGRRHYWHSNKNYIDGFAFGKKHEIKSKII